MFAVVRSFEVIKVFKLVMFNVFIGVIALTCLVAAAIFLVVR